MLSWNKRDSIIAKQSSSIPIFLTFARSTPCLQIRMPYSLKGSVSLQMKAAFIATFIWEVKKLCFGFYHANSTLTPSGVFSYLSK